MGARDLRGGRPRSHVEHLARTAWALVDRVAADSSGTSLLQMVGIPDAKRRRYICEYVAGARMRLVILETMLSNEYRGSACIAFHSGAFANADHNLSRTATLS